MDLNKEMRSRKTNGIYSGEETETLGVFCLI